MYKPTRDSLKEIVDKTLISQHNFEGLYHFTDIKNLSSILSDGYLRSRGECIKQDLNFFDSGYKLTDLPLLHLEDKVRFHFKEKTPSLFDSEGVKSNSDEFHVPIPVYLVFDEELLYLEETIYTSQSPEDKDCKFGNTLDFFKNIEWSKIFRRGPLSEQDDRELAFSFRNAEVLLPHSVSLSYLNRIVFRSEIDKKRFLKDFVCPYECVVDKRKFFSENLYLDDFSIQHSQNGLILTLTMNSPISLESKSYSHKIEFIDKNNNSSIKNLVLDLNGYHQTFSFTMPDMKDGILNYYLNDVLSFSEKI